MSNYLLDFETRSALPIEAGMERYLRTTVSDIICMSWSLNNEPVQLWTPNVRQQPFIPEPDDKVYAFNIQFDQRVWNVLATKLYGWHSLPLENCIDVMALCGRYGWPQKLEMVGRVLNLDVQKNPRGKVLMKKICSPPFVFTQRELEEFYDYCEDDLNTMRELIHVMPADHLSPEEQRAWELTVRMNRRGVPIDRATVVRVNEVVNYYRDREMARVPTLSDGAFKTTNQVAAVREWCKEMGVQLPNLQAETVRNALDAENLPPTVKRILTMRLEFARTSLAKYKRILEQIYQGRIYGNLRYFGGHTGRWAGLGVQLHNLPRMKLTTEEIEYLIACFKDGSILTMSPMAAAKDLIRPMIRASKGKKFAIIDYKSIENVLLAWASGEERSLKLHRDGRDEYKDFATILYRVAYDDVTKEQRNTTKPVVLGAGYMMAGGRLLQYAQSMGVQLTPMECETAIGLYRQTHPMVKSFWYTNINNMKAAIRHPGMTFTYRGVIQRTVTDRNGRTWLQLTLPSGRAMYYDSPKIIEGRFGETPSHLTLDSQTKQYARREISPGLLTENIIQASARDVLVDGCYELENGGYEPLITIHDEVVIEVDINHNDMRGIVNLMCVKPVWADDLPLGAEGEYHERYRKI